MNKKGNCYHKFTDFGVRMTTARKNIIDILLDTQEHLSVEDIFKKAHVMNPSIGLTTVYRTLDLLEQMGMLQKYVFGNGKARYELSSNKKGSKFHHHLICVSCKAIVDYSDFSEDEILLIKSIEKKLLRKQNFKTLNHISYFCGICGKCQNL